MKIRAVIIAPAIRSTTASDARHPDSRTTYRMLPTRLCLYGIRCTVMLSADMSSFIVLSEKWPPHLNVCAVTMIFRCVRYALMEQDTEQPIHASQTLSRESRICTALEEVVRKLVDPKAGLRSGLF